jgi:phosphatidylglycerophosphate synthase
MDSTPPRGDDSWQTKPTDRFVLKWIKVHLSAPITLRLLAAKQIEPRRITLVSCGLGVLAGLIFALGAGWLAGILAACAQVLDGVDGQYARITGKQSKGGAFWDSVLDRYADGAMVVGMVVYSIRLGLHFSPALLLAAGYMAITGANLISYSTSRAENLGIDLGSPTLASKGTRTTAMILSGWGSFFWPPLPLLAILYLALHTNLVVICRLRRGTVA